MISNTCIAQFDYLKRQPREQHLYCIMYHICSNIFSVIFKLLSLNQLCLYCCETKNDLKLHQAFKEDWNVFLHWVTSRCDPNNLLLLGGVCVLHILVILFYSCMQKTKNANFIFSKKCNKEMNLFEKWIERKNLLFK